MRLRYYLTILKLSKELSAYSAAFFHDIGFGVYFGLCLLVVTGEEFFGKEQGRNIGGNATFWTAEIAYSRYVHFFF